MSFVVVLVLVGAMAPAGAARGKPRSGEQLWVNRYAGPGNIDSATAVKASPDGTRVFVTGYSHKSGSGDEYATAAYDAATGATLWGRTYKGGSTGFADAMAVSPDGTKVFVTGISDGGSTGNDAATIAYDAATGATVWESRYNCRANSDDEATDVQVSPDGSQVFVTGSSFCGTGTEADFLTIAYEAATGVERWVSRADGPRHGSEGALAMAVSPDGARLFVTGITNREVASDWMTVAYDPSGGAQLWVQTIHFPAALYDGPSAIAASPDGTRVFITGTGSYPDRYYDYTTVAYEAASGHVAWAKRYRPLTAIDSATAVAVSPDGTRVFVTGNSSDVNIPTAIATIAYDASDGKTVWVTRYDDPYPYGFDEAAAIGVSPDGSRVYVAGQAEGGHHGPDYVTIAYDADTGAGVWLRRYDGSHARDDATALAVSADGTQVFVTGLSKGSFTFDWATVAYAA